MKSNAYKIILFAALVVLSPRLAWAEESPTFSQKIEQFAANVKKTVVDIWNRWVGAEPLREQKPDERAVASAKVDPAAQPNQAAANVPGNAAPAPATAVPQAAPVEASVKKVVAETPVQEIKQYRKDLRSKNPFSVKSEGRQADSRLKKTKSGVPLFSLIKVKDVPALDIGQEPEISRNDLSIPDWNWRVKQLEQTHQLPMPQPLSAKESAEATHGFPKAQPVKLSPSDKQLIEGHVTKEKIERIEYKTKEVSETAPLPYEPMSQDYVKMLVTKILFERGDRCPVVIGLADEMSNKPDFRTEALFEGGSCAKELKLNQVAFDKLSEVIKKQDAEFGPRSLTILGKGLPLVFETAFYGLVKGLDGKEEYFSDKKVSNEIFYRAAKGAFKEGQYKAAEKWAARVEGSSSFGSSAQYLVGISQYGAKEKAAGKETLEKLSSTIEHSSDNVLKGLVSVDLARMDFTSHKYDQALPLYLKIPKDHPLWVQALIEQGWTQLAVDDFAGAIGNMYSLHSPYFRVLFQPQSFVVRTVGYLNICQYGDAYRTLTKLEQDYRDWQTKLADYLGSKQSGAAYETVKQYLKSKSTTDVDGLPYQLVREAARGKEFLNLQNAINDKSDEVGAFSGVNEKIRKEKENIRLRALQAKKRADQLASKFAVMKKAGASANQLEAVKHQWEKERLHSVPNRYELEVIEESQQAFVRFQRSSQTKIMEVQHKLVSNASQVLYNRFKAMKSEMTKVLDNNEFLRYEIFAGSGENIRYQVAGGQTGGENRLPASVKPQKMMNWSFDGEFWEDEIGNYRSSLKNNCPKSGTQAKGE